ncbi:hypothetical protein WJX74_002828 [Apatococcus lobatus]|uniref:C3H1-type domain-containing protein n=1 Tax=Apatococcus lobatus TaxID=904363 RepID=A0AAW1RS97_9CHLO
MLQESAVVDSRIDVFPLPAASAAHDHVITQAQEITTHGNINGTAPATSLHGGRQLQSGAGSNEAGISVPLATPAPVAAKPTDPRLAQRMLQAALTPAKRPDNPPTGASKLHMDEEVETYCMARAHAGSYGGHPCHPKCTGTDSARSPADPRLDSLSHQGGHTKPRPVPPARKLLTPACINTAAQQQDSWTECAPAAPQRKSSVQQPGVGLDTSQHQLGSQAMPQPSTSLPSLQLFESISGPVQHMPSSVVRQGPDQPDVGVGAGVDASRCHSLAAPDQASSQQQPLSSQAQKYPHQQSLRCTEMLQEPASMAASTHPSTASQQPEANPATTQQSAAVFCGPVLAFKGLPAGQINLGCLAQRIFPQQDVPMTTMSLPSLPSAAPESPCNPVQQSVAHPMSTHGTSSGLPSLSTQMPSNARCTAQKVFPERMMTQSSMSLPAFALAAPASPSPYDQRPGALHRSLLHDLTAVLASAASQQDAPISTTQQATFHPSMPHAPRLRTKISQAVPALPSSTEQQSQAQSMGIPQNGMPMPKLSSFEQIRASIAAQPWWHGQNVFVTPRPEPSFPMPAAKLTRTTQHQQWKNAASSQQIAHIPGPAAQSLRPMDLQLQALSVPETMRQEPVTAAPGFHCAEQQVNPRSLHGAASEQALASAAAPKLASSIHDPDLQAPDLGMLHPGCLSAPQPIPSRHPSPALARPPSMQALRGIPVSSQQEPALRTAPLSQSAAGVPGAISTQFAGPASQQDDQASAAMSRDYGQCPQQSNPLTSQEQLHPPNQDAYNSLVLTQGGLGVEKLHAHVGDDAWDMEQHVKGCLNQIMIESHRQTALLQDMSSAQERHANELTELIRQACLGRADNPSRPLVQPADFGASCSPLCLAGSQQVDACRQSSEDLGFKSQTPHAIARFDEPRNGQSTGINGLSSLPNSDDQSLRALLLQPNMARSPSHQQQPHHGQSVGLQDLPGVHMQSLQQPEDVLLPDIQQTAAGHAADRLRPILQQSEDVLPPEDFWELQDRLAVIEARLDQLRGLEMEQQLGNLQWQLHELRDLPEAVALIMNAIGDILLPTVNSCKALQLSQADTTPGRCSGGQAKRHRQEHLTIPTASADMRETFRGGSGCRSVPAACQDTPDGPCGSSDQCHSSSNCSASEDEPGRHIPSTHAAAGPRKGRRLPQAQHLQAPTAHQDMKAPDGAALLPSPKIPIALGQPATEGREFAISTQAEHGLDTARPCAGAQSQQLQPSRLPCGPQSKPCSLFPRMIAAPSCIPGLSASAHTALQQDPATFNEQTMAGMSSPLNRAWLHSPRGTGIPGLQSSPQPAAQPSKHPATVAPVHTSKYQSSLCSSPDALTSAEEQRRDPSRGSPALLVSPPAAGANIGASHTAASPSDYLLGMLNEQAGKSPQHQADQSPLLSSSLHNSDPVSKTLSMSGLTQQPAPSLEPVQNQPEHSTLPSSCLNQPVSGLGRPASQPSISELLAQPSEDLGTSQHQASPSQMPSNSMNKSSPSLGQPRGSASVPSISGLVDQPFTVAGQPSIVSDQPQQQASGVSSKAGSLHDKRGVKVSAPTTGLEHSRPRSGRSASPGRKPHKADTAKRSRGRSASSTAPSKHHKNHHGDLKVSPHDSSLAAAKQHKSSNARQMPLRPSPSVYRQSSKRRGRSSSTSLSSRRQSTTTRRRSVSRGSSPAPLHKRRRSTGNRRSDQRLGRDRGVEHNNDRQERLSYAQNDERSHVRVRRADGQLLRHSAPSHAGSTIGRPITGAGIAPLDLAAMNRPLSSHTAGARHAQAQGFRGLKNALWKTAVCLDWKAGKCNKPAHACNFAHGEADKQRTHQGGTVSLAPRITDPTLAGIFRWSSHSSEESIKAHAMSSASCVGKVRSVSVKLDRGGGLYAIVTFNSPSDAGAFIAQRLLEPLDGHVPSIQPWTGATRKDQRPRGALKAKPANFLSQDDMGRVGNKRRLWT